MALVSTLLNIMGSAAGSGSNSMSLKIWTKSISFCTNVGPFNFVNPE